MKFVNPHKFDDRGLENAEAILHLQRQRLTGLVDPVATSALRDLDRGLNAIAQIRNYTREENA